MSPQAWRDASWAIGDNQVTAAFVGSAGLFPSQSTSTLDVAKGPQAAPELTASGETVLGRGDGAIGGLTTAMEYASDEEGPYVPVTDPGIDFGVGTYWVRLADDAKHLASPAARVDVGAGPRAHVALPDDQVGYSLRVDNPNISWTEVAAFSLSLEDGWEKGPDFAVKVNGTPVDLKDGGFSISHPDAPALSVTVEGLVRVFAWTYSADDMPDGQCAIVGWDGVQPKDGVAVAPAVHDGLKVTWIKGSLSSLSPYAGLSARLDFSAAVDLATVERNAFSGCTGLTGPLSIPAAASIGDSAFDRCTGLTSLSLPAATDIGDFAFYGCTGLTSLSLPVVSSVGVDAFSGCTGLTSLSLPEAASIGAQAFRGCSALASISLPKAAVIGARAFRELRGISGPLSLPAATDIGTFAFYGCTGLTSLSLPAATDVGDSAFENCTSLSGELSIPKTVSAGSRAFYGCTGLTSLSLPAATDVGDSAFENCVGLTGTLSLPSATGIGHFAFASCSFSSVELGGNLAFLGMRAFAGNRLAHLELPGNPALDAPYDEEARAGVGTAVMTNQRPDATAYYVPVGGGQGETELDGLAALGADASRMSSLALASSPDQGPANADWHEKLRARFPLEGLSRTGAQLDYGYEVRRADGDGRALSTGSASVPLGPGAEYRFRAYRGAGAGSPFDERSQWLFPGEKPDPGDDGGFGLVRAGYRLPSGGWRVGDGPSAAGGPVDPAAQAAAPGGVYRYYNNWVANAYLVAFDDGFARMVALEPRLGMPGPAGGPGTVPDPSLVHGRVAGLAHLTYGEPSPLPDGSDPGNSFFMGSFRFEGWATSPDLAEGARVAGSNFFPPGAALSSPAPVTVGGTGKDAPDPGDEIVLYAQWRAQDLSAPGQIAASILIPQSVTLVQDGAHLWSKDSNSPVGSGPHAVGVETAPDRPGAYWPTDADHVYRVSVVPPVAGGPLLALTNPSDPRPHTIDVLATPDGPPYDPAPPTPGGPPNALISLQPVTAGAPTPASGAFYLRSRDAAWDFLDNIDYSGTITFRID